MDDIEMIYNFKEHGLQCINNTRNMTIVLTLVATQLEFDYQTGNLITIFGYLPLFNAKKKNIDLPAVFTDTDFSIDMNDFDYCPGIAYEYCEWFPKSEKYLLKGGIPIVCFDRENKRILIGTKDQNDKSIKINKNIICGLDHDCNLKYLLISIDLIIE